MTRLASLLILLPVSVAACDEPRFEHAFVQVDPVRAEVSLALRGNAAPPCPELPYEDTEIHLAGNAGSIYDWGGEDCDPDVCYDQCRDVEAEWYDVAQPTIDLTVETPDLRIAIAADWPESLDIASFDDLEAAAATGGTFTVSWTPDDAAIDYLHVYEGDRESPTLSLIELSRGPGTATFQFSGERATTPLAVIARLSLERVATTCEGIDECTVGGHVTFDLVMPPQPPLP